MDPLRSVFAISSFPSQGFVPNCRWLRGRCEKYPFMGSGYRLNSWRRCCLPFISSCIDTSQPCFHCRGWWWVWRGSAILEEFSPTFWSSRWKACFWRDSRSMHVSSCPLPRRRLDDLQSPPRRYLRLQGGRWRGWFGLLCCYRVIYRLTSWANAPIQPSYCSGQKNT